MPYAQTKILKSPTEIDSRLTELDLRLSPLLQVRNIAMDAAGSAQTPFHCANAEGTMAYQQGIWAIRDQFVGDLWKVSRMGGVEAIVNESKKLRVSYCNVDSACQDAASPKPRSNKGAGAERVSDILFAELPEYAEVPTGDWALYYLMVDRNGACELSRPIIRSGTFQSCVERIYISDGADYESDIIDLDAEDVTDVFQPLIARKR